MNEKTLKSMPDANRNGRLDCLPLLCVFLSWAIIAGISCFSYAPPTPLASTVPADQFSAGRAEDFLQQLVGDAIPHPAGSPQNAIVRKRIVGLLESFGYSVEIQTGIGKVDKAAKSRSPDRASVELHNIVAVLRSRPPGSEDLASERQKLMLVSHYDSVPTGPGASDDGVATAAVIEIARMLASEPPPNRDIVFLITDGEEFGLLGAKLFVAEHPLAKSIGITINLEARGTTGPSCMFETSRQSRLLVPIYARSSRKKFASSLFFEIYRRMPNDTDFSVFNAAGIQGYNFAFVGNVKNYHTSADDLENADRGSLQHHGENALGLIRELLADPAAGRLIDGEVIVDDAVYFDLFGRWIVWWPSGWSIWLAVISMILSGTASWRFLKKSQFTAGNDAVNFISGSDPNQPFRFVDVFKNFGILMLILVAVYFGNYLLQILVRLDPRMSNPWPANPTLMVIGYWLAGFAIAGAIGTWFSQSLRPLPAWMSTCVFWLVAAGGSSAIVNGASHLFVVPVLIAALIGLVMSFANRIQIVSVIVVTAIVIGLMWLPLERLFYDAVGFKKPVIMCGRIAIVTTPVMCLLSTVSHQTKFYFSITAAVASVSMFAAAILLS